MTPRYKLRTLLMLLAILPPLLWIGWTKYAAWKADQERQRALLEFQRRLEYELAFRNRLPLKRVAPIIDDPQWPELELPPAATSEQGKGPARPRD